MKIINCALFEAVEGHATTDPGMRDILESTEENHRAPAGAHRSVSYGGSPASGAQPSVTTSTDQNAGTGDVTREVRTGPTQDVTRANKSDDMGDDFVMR